MQHIAIDLGGRESQVCVRSATGEIVEESKQPTSKLERFFREREKARVILETCAEAFRVADAALAEGHEVRVVPATLVRSLGVGEHGIKTDKRDARKLSEVSCRIDLPTVHVPSMTSREQRAICRQREALVQARTLLVNSVRGYLRTQLLRPRSGGTETFPKRVRKLLETRPEGLSESLERMLKSIECLTEQIELANKELAQIADVDPICQTLISHPGVGPVTSVLFRAKVDRIERFPNAHKLESCLGLTAGENSSSQRQQRTGITKAGSPQLRWVLVQAAWSLWRTRPEDPMVLWAQQVAKRRGRQVAIVALARKMVGVLYAMWRDGTTYDPSRAAKAVSKA